MPSPAVSSAPVRTPILTGSSQRARVFSGVVGDVASVQRITSFFMRYVRNLAMVPQFRWFRSVTLWFSYDFRITPCSGLIVCRWHRQVPGIELVDESRNLDGTVMMTTHGEEIKPVLLNGCAAKRVPSCGAEQLLAARTDLGPDSNGQKLLGCRLGETSGRRLRRVGCDSPRLCDCGPEASGRLKAIALTVETMESQVPLIIGGSCPTISRRARTEQAGHSDLGWQRICSRRCQNHKTVEPAKKTSTQVSRLKTPARGSRSSV